MALSPPRTPTPAAPSDEERRAALDKAHAGAVALLEHQLDRSLAGKLGGVPPAAPVVLTLPIGTHTPEVLADVCAHYVKAGWERATLGTNNPGPSGIAILTLTPPGYVAPEPPAS
jgi:hypothetical protein